MAERPADSVRSIEAARPLRIGLLVGPMVPVPPIAYGGTERVVAALAAELSGGGLHRGGNAPFSQWGRTFTGPRLAAVVVDHAAPLGSAVRTG